MQRSSLRWFVLGLLFSVTVINYLDRLLFSTLSPVLRDEFHFGPALYGYLSAAFQAAYALGFLFLGRWVDRVGTRRGLLAAVSVWSAASILHATVRQPSQFLAWRAVLGFSEGANFPAVFKSLAEWFSPEERSLATGILNAGVNAASMIGPPMFVVLTERFGWRTCFIAISSLGFVWIVVWAFKYQAPEQVQANTPAAHAVPWGDVLRHRPAWGYAISKVLVDPTWYFLLFWLPFYFRDAHHLDMREIGWALPVIYFASGAGSLLGGLACERLLRRGWTLKTTRLACLAACAVVMPAAAYGATRTGAMASIVILSMAAAAHQAFSSISFMLPADVFPSTSVGSVLGFGGFTGAMSGVIFSAVLPGYLVPIFGYLPLLITLTFGYAASVLVIWKLFGEFRPAI